MSEWNIPKEYLDQSKEIERLKAKVAMLEAEVVRLATEKTKWIYKAVKAERN